MDPTFNFSIYGLFTIPDIDHKESICSLIETFDEVVKVPSGIVLPTLSQCFKEATFIYEDPDIELEGFGGELFPNGLRQLGSTFTPTYLTLGNLGQ